MRLSCNGCRVLRKGCGENCTIRPCLQWITSSDSQAHATLFLAKFYGRAGLVNLINAGPEHLRPAVFRSLLYEACGRIVNPVHGSVGLLGNGNWQLCHEAVEAVLRGEPIKQVSYSSPSSTSLESALQAADIRHVARDDNNSVDSTRSRLCKVVKSKGQFKRSAPKPKQRTVELMAELGGLAATRDSVVSCVPSSGSDGSSDGDCVSVETVEVSLAKLDEPADGGEINLELTLGL
ncbi:hypothetical protein Tsubulata_039111 [Turnera subulata]|uniref:LOB domain-containing protein n=1 Tax=Turnera subulata TaxID=218843 RepID=A0A9Q0J2J9_9ROSI|nr:hypothetical protein Tsubulata_039111 [Turnera subulata]